MASVSSTSSLGNTSLRGFGGMASGIDRDAIIEKMTLGTTTKISNRKKDITKLQWKQEAYRNLSDKIIDLSDKYASYSSTSNLKDPLAFAKNIISVHGREEATRFVSATGSSSLIDNISITGVQQLATSAVLQSQKHTGENGLQTSLNGLDGRITPTSVLGGTKIRFGTYTDGKWSNVTDFTLPTSYTVGEGDDAKKVTISYVPQEVTLSDGTKRMETDEEFARRLTADLNAALEHSDIKIGAGEEKDKVALKDAIGFEVGTDADGNEIVKLVQKKDMPGNITINAKSSALAAMGYQVDGDKASVSISDLNSGTIGKFSDAALRRPSTIDYLTNKTLTFNYDGNKKEIALLTKDEADYLKNLENYQKRDPNFVETDADGNLVLTEAGKEQQLKDMAELLQGRLERAFGKDTVKAQVSADGNLSFTTTGASSSISIISNDTELLQNLGIAYGESNKVNLGGKLTQSALKEDVGDLSQYKNGDSEELYLKINGVEIKGITANSTIEDIISKINSTTAAGVKATYVDATGQFMLVSTETGAGRDIDVSSDRDASGNITKNNLAEALFGVGTGDEKGEFVEGQNAKVQVSYGNGVTVNLERASNTFNLEGLNVTVSGVFGGEWGETKDIAGASQDILNKIAAGDGYMAVKDKDGNVTGYKEWKADSSETVTFSAKADVDAAVEKVKSFFEDFNALVADINGQVRTRPDSSYEPLTDEQKAELDETSIENWENKAKQGILYGDSIIRDLSGDVEGIFSKLMSNGARYDDLKKIGISYSEDWSDGGTLVFDEAAFRSAMESDPELVSNIFTGGGDVKKGLISVVEDTFTPYATRYASRNSNGQPGSGHYGRLIEMAGSEKKPSTLYKNEIYKQIEEMQKVITNLQDQLKVEQDRYISQFTTMETLLNQMNTQSSYLSQLTA